MEGLREYILQNLKPHIGHTLRFVTYGSNLCTPCPVRGDPCRDCDDHVWNFALECEDCSTVIFDFDMSEGDQ